MTPRTDFPSRPLAKAIAGLVAVLPLFSGCGDPAAPGTCTTAPGSICTWAGTGEPAFNGEGLALRASALYWPMDVEFAPDGAAFVIDWQNHRVRRADPGGNARLKTVIGTDAIGDGPDDGSETPPGVPGTTINLNHPTDLQIASDGTLLLAAWHNHKVRRYSPQTELVELACGSKPGFAGDDGPAAAALLNQPKALVVTPVTGEIFVLDTRNFRVRRIQPDGDHVINTVVGIGTAGFSGDGGPPAAAQLKFQKPGDNPEPGGALALDQQGRLYIADTENQRIRRVDFQANIIETVVGTGVAGFSGDGGPATQATINYPRDMEFGPDGRLYIADSDNHRVRAVDMDTGIITTVAGSGELGFDGDGGPANLAKLARPFGIGFDPLGNLFIADTFNNRIRKVVRQ
jgi:DNA-binding beta-propeller fold protein YncE